MSATVVYDSLSKLSVDKSKGRIPRMHHDPTRNSLFQEGLPPRDCLLTNNNNNNKKITTTAKTKTKLLLNLVGTFLEEEIVRSHGDWLLFSHR